MLHGEEACESTSSNLTHLYPLPFEKKISSSLHSPAVPAGVILRKCLTKSSLFSDFALRTRPRIIFFVSGSGLVRDAGSNCRASWNWIIISLTSRAEWSGMDWMEFLTLSGSASSFRFAPWKWYRIYWNSKEPHWSARRQTHDDGKQFVNAQHLELVAMPIPRERSLFEILSYQNL